MEANWREWKIATSFVPSELWTDAKKKEEEVSLKAEFIVVGSNKVI